MLIFVFIWLEIKLIVLQLGVLLCELKTDDLKEDL